VYAGRTQVFARKFSRASPHMRMRACPPSLCMLRTALLRKPVSVYIFESTPQLFCPSTGCTQTDVVHGVARDPIYSINPFTASNHLLHQTFRVRRTFIAHALRQKEREHIA